MKSFTSYNLRGKEFPQKLPPWNLTLIKGLTTLAKFALPLVLESIYKNMETTNISLMQSEQLQQENESLWMILVKITLSLSLCYFLELFCEYTMSEYQLNLKKEMTKRIVENSVIMYTKFKQQGVFYVSQGDAARNHAQSSHGNQQNLESQQAPGIRSKVQENSENQQTQSDSPQQLPSLQLPQFFTDKLSLWTNISSKMPVYVYNYHNSLLSLVFESLNIVGVCVYLYIKLSYSLVFGLILALLIMKKIVSVTHQMQGRFFNNIQLRQKKLKLLKHFFNHLVEYKMTWLDKWIWTKIAQTETQYQNNLQEIKYLDVWCVALWRFTSISISSVVVIAFYYLEIQATQTITPSTLIQFFMILTMPLNALSWNIAGVKNSLRAIEQLKYTVSLVGVQEKKQKLQTSQSDQNKQCYVNLSQKVIELKKDEQFSIKFNTNSRQTKYVFGEVICLKCGQYVSVNGKKQAEYFMNVLPFVLKNKFHSLGIQRQIGYVEQNSWQIDNILESLSFKQRELLQQNKQIQHETDKNTPTLLQLLQLFDCHDIPQFSTISSKQLSGGEKMRINLVRAFLNCKIVVINSDLTCVDVKMRQKIAVGFNYLITTYGYTVFCRRIQVIGENFLQNVVYLNFMEKAIDRQEQTKEQKINKMKIINIFSSSKNQRMKSETFQFKNLEKIAVSKELEKKLAISLSKQKQHLQQEGQSEDPERSNLCCFRQSNLDSLKWQTFTSYYKSKYHIVFLVGIICTTIFEHSYQFYMNNYVKIESMHNGTGLTAENIKYIIVLTLVFAGSLFVRAFYFAVANIEEGKRISAQLDQNIVMNEIDFYENFNFKNNNQTKQEIKEGKGKNQIEQSLKSLNGSPSAQLPFEQQEQQSQENVQNKGVRNVGSKLIYHGTTDIAEVCDGFSWKANILFNNIFTTASSILIVFSQIPFIGLILIPIILFTIYMNNQYQTESQRLLKVQKKVEENLLKTVHQIEEGIKYIYLYNKIEFFKRSVYESVDKQINIEWRLGQLKRNLNAKYKSMMIFFLILIVIAFGMVGLYPNQNHVNSVKQSIQATQNKFQSYLHSINNGKCNFQKNQSFQNDSQRNRSGKFVILINYTITLANFMLFFTVSLGQTTTLALSIQRIRPLISLQNSEKSSQRLKDVEQVLRKIQSAVHSPQNFNLKDTLISIRQLDFSYDKKDQRVNSQNQVFQGLNLELKPQEKIQIRGKSGNGKTTLYKLLCSLYKNTLNTLNYPFHISFSPQHPLMLPSAKSVLQNLDPYQIFQFDKDQSKPLVKQSAVQSKRGLKNYIIDGLRKQNSEESPLTKQAIDLLDKSLDSLTYKEKIMVNNLRAWLYGRNGVKIYDQPFWVDVSERQSYILTTHQRQFKHDKVLFLQNKKLIQR